MLLLTIELKPLLLGSKTKIKNLSFKRKIENSVSNEKEMTKYFFGGYTVTTKCEEKYVRIFLSLYQGNKDFLFVSHSFPFLSLSFS